MQHPARSLRLLSALLPFALLATAACNDDEGYDPSLSASSTSVGSGGEGGAGEGGAGGGGGGEEPGDKWPLVECDPLVPEVCMMPFPSNVFSVADESTKTGRRVSISDKSLPVSFNGYQPSGAPWSKSDGFSASASILAYLPGATAEGFATPETIERSLEDDSPTVLIDAETGARIPHWAEVDRTTDKDEQRSLILRPAVRLEDGRRYIVALRSVVDALGAPVPPSAAFSALVSGEASDEPSIEARRPLYKEIFELLDLSGVSLDGLQLAWDFTTASRESNTGWLVHMRDEALEMVASDAPTYTITKVDTDWNTDDIAFRIDGTMTVPLYLDNPGPGGHLLFGDDGMPEPSGTTEVEWELIIPQSALTAPAKLLQYGHGLLGSRSQIESGHFLTFMNQYNYAMFAVNLAGMDEDDETWIGQKVGLGKVDELSAMFDRMHQGFLNYILAMRMMSQEMSADATYGQYLDGSQRHYFGISQGGIAGGVYMALTTDIERGMLEVMGQPYTVLLDRSVDFDPFFVFLRLGVPDARDQLLFLAATQMLWDRTEPSGYTRYITHDMLPNTPAHQVFMRAAIGDHQVTPYGAHIMARAVGAVHLDTGLRDIFGLTKMASPLTSEGAAYAEYDFGLPDPPICNLPLSACEDPHGKLRKLDEARAQLDHFLTTGEFVNFCTGGADGKTCSHPEASGCVGGEDPSKLCE